MGVNFNNNERALVQRGFTLLELMITLVIMGIVLAIAIPAYSAWRERTAVRTASDTLVAHLKQARIMATSENRCVTVVFNTAVPSYTIETRAGSLDVLLSQYSNQLTMATSIAATTKAFVFRSDGSAGTNTCAAFSAALGAVTIAVPSGSSHSITMNSLGRVFL